MRLYLDANAIIYAKPYPRSVTPWSHGSQQRRPLQAGWS
jgi:hypothetical protein